ncbi:MAG: Rid family detoxifying hydrolase [Anaerolineae bacterium]
MPRTIIATPHTPAAIGPYSQAVSTGALIYTSGQLGLDPATGQLAQGVEAQARQVMANLAAVLAAAGSSLDLAVKSTIFLQNMADFAVVNAVYGAAFSVAPPARSTVQVAGLPLGGLVEIEVIALAGA